MPKHTLRQPMLARRRALDHHERLTASTTIQEALLASAEFTAAGTVSLYAAIQNEVDTGMLFSVAVAAGKTVVFPVVTGESLIFRSVTSPRQFESGRFGIPEPAAERPSVSLLDIDLFVIPAVAFSLDGHRIGYGRGFYDRALHQLEGAGKLAGICYDFQLVESLPDEPHDVRMDLIVTEKRVVRPRTLYRERRYFGSEN